jgi:hypothetical protein
VYTNEAEKMWVRSLTAIIGVGDASHKDQIIGQP